MKDLFSKDCSTLLNKKLWLFDMDGTIYNEDTIFEGVLDLLEYINKNEGRYVFITNNSSKSVKDYVNKINSMGIKADIDNFFTSTQATALMLEEKYPNAKVYCQGTKAMILELQGKGISVTTDVTPKPDVVLVGFDTEITSEKLRKTCEVLKDDVAYYATNPDLVCPVSFGFIPDCGSICDMIKNATGKYPIYIGKPEPTMVDIVRKKFGFTCDETVVVGDRLYTDIAAGFNAGVDTVCVLTGEATLKEIEKSNIKPSFVLHCVKDIYSYFQNR